jgi:eukaryotic-like serine/threonine-protein kinase
MGVVYKARQRSPNRLVALKMILAGFGADVRRRAFFRAEADAIACLAHPNIVQIHEIGEHGGAPFLCLEYVDGGSLDKRLAGKPQPALRAAELVATLARAIHFAHEHGIVHRDLKPANVLLSNGQGVGRELSGQNRPADARHSRDDHSSLNADRPKITDFGLAKNLDSGKTLLDPGAVAGTPSYMAPEQVRGTSPTIGPAVDIYALGAILYEMLTGRAPFGAENAYDTLLQVVHQEPVPLRQLQPKLPRDLETICLKCLHKDPRKRYARALDLADDLQRFGSGQPITARPIGTLERTAKWARRRPAVAGLLAAIVLVTALALGLVSWFWNQAETRADAEARAKEHEKEARLEVERLTASTLLDQATSVSEQGEIGHGLLLFARALELAADSGNDALERVARWNLAGWRSKLIRIRAECHHDGYAWSVDYSPDGQTLLTAGSDGLIQRWDTLTGRALGRPLRHPQPVWAMAQSPDGKLILSGAGPDGGPGEARLWDATSGELRGRPIAHASEIRKVMFSADGQTMLTVSPPSAHLWKTATLAPVGPPLHPGGVRTAVFSPNGKMVLTSGDDSTARLWDAATGTPLGEPMIHDGSVHLVAFSPDGAVLATASRPRALASANESSQRYWSEVRLWDAATLRLRKPALLHEGLVKTMTFNPDGQMLATGTAVMEFDGQAPHWRAKRGQARLWHVGTGKPVHGPLFHPLPVWSTAFPPDGRLLLTGCEDGRARFFEVVSGKEIGRPLVHEGTVTSVAFSPDGTTAATSSAGGDHTGAAARLWEIPPQPQVVRTPPNRSDAGHILLFTADNTALLTANESPQTLERRNVRTGAKLEPSIHQESHIEAIALTPDGKQVFTFARDRVARVWDLAKASLLRSWPIVELVHAAAISSDGQTLLIRSADQKIRLWDIASSQPLTAAIAHRGAIADIAFAADGRAIWMENVKEAVTCWRMTADGSPEMLSLWDDDALRGAFGPAAAFLLARGKANRPVKHDAVQGYSFHSLDSIRTRHADRIQGLGVSRDGKTLATGSWDQTARLWDVITGRPLGPPLAHPGRVNKVAVCAERGVVAVQCDATYLWPIPPSVDGSAEEVRLWVESLTGQTMDRQGNVSDLTRDDIRERQERLNGLKRRERGNGE